ncbi:ATP-dependent DNA helicase DinG [Pontibacillus salicampi]|uniref:3'-5' exonuclease DinG n=1 Tax=Pontibacillus salicampi TaxID=1449801 RepID=A0ABV6LLA4_9BACI
MAKYVVVDLETTGHSPKKGDKIIEVGMVTVEDGKVVDQYKSFVNPEQPIPSFITQLTGIRDEDVLDAPLFDEIVDDILLRCQGAYFVAHHVEFDLGFLNHALIDAVGHGLSVPVMDTVELARIFIPQADGYKLSQLSEFLQVNHGEPHRALADAYVTSQILIQLLHKAEQLPYETLEQLAKLERKWKSDMSEVLNQLLHCKTFEKDERDDLELFRGIAIKKSSTKEEEQPSVETEGFEPFLDHVFHKDGWLEGTLHNFEERDGQREMAITIYDAFQSKSKAMIEAETGTGKTLAYLVPAIYEAVEQQSRIMISTHTTQLQAQLLEKDIPMLENSIPFPFQSALLKGKQHYLSLKKFEYELHSSVANNYDVILTKSMILVWLTETTTGDIDDIQLPSSGAIFWRKVSAEAEGYLDPRSPWYSRSFYQRAKKKAQQAHLVITNHSLLCTDIIHDYGLVSSYPKVIIDEAHHFEAAAGKHFGLKLDYISIQYLLNEMGGNKAGDWMHNLLSAYPELALKQQMEMWEVTTQSIKEEADELFRYLFTYVSKQREANISLNDVGRFQYRYHPDKESSKVWSTVREMAHRVSFIIRDTITFLIKCSHWIQAAETSEEASRWREDIKMYVERLELTIDALDQLLLSDESQLVKWIEIEAYGAKNSVYIYSEPIEVGSLLKEYFFDKKDSVILTSATLTMKQSFSFMMKRLGLDKDKTIQKQIPSPFQYKDQVQLLVPNDFPGMKYGSQDEFIYATCEAIYSLASISKGRMLVLFTSYEMLKKAHGIMKELMDVEEFMLIAQGISSGSRSRLKKNFQAFDQAILFGTSSFWEGVDIPGDDLTSLVIVRLPFQPPNHPVYEAKAESIKDQGKNPFMELSLPNAVIRFKQGFGRLIRSTTDKGIVMVCDDRIMKAKYGKYFTQSIPEIDIHYDSTHQLMKKAERWL